MPEQRSKCDVCGKTKEEGAQLKDCGRCKSRTFCGTTCQRADWPSHKASCKAKAKANNKWYDAHRKCRDGSSHFGELELITWEGVAESTGERLGWGNCLISEGPALKRKYEEEFGCDDSKLFKEWPQAYRWTCCGTGGDMKWGCDHHGSGPRPCECDYCHMGKPVPDDVFNGSGMERRGLTLLKGPDRRSYNPMKAGNAEMGQELAGSERGCETQ
ncbi:hypothetical protein DL769_011706 [Monosporascus sp. CRB-8-3]|nr:hypothetical protein DL769_011706 [Monosporascus sp. CRB-8-3]